MQYFKSFSIFKAIFSFFMLASIVSNAQTNFKVTGTVLDLKVNEITLTIDKELLNHKPAYLKAAVQGGEFEISARLDQNRILKLSGDRMPVNIYAEPGDEIRMNWKNTDTTAAVTFTGKGAEHNSFLKTFYDKFKNDFDDSIMHPMMLNTGVDAFEMSVFDSRKKQMEFFKNAPDKNKFSPAFTEYITNTINYRYWNLLLAYPIVNANSSNKILVVNGLPYVMLDSFTKVRVNNDSALISEAYREFLKYYVVYFTSQANGFKKFTDLSMSAEKKLALAKERLKGAAYPWWLARFTIDECERQSPAVSKKLFSELKSADPSGSYVAIVNEVCGTRMAMKEEKKKEEKSTTATGSSSGGKDELDLTDVNGKHVSLSDFKGKVVYIDFWASWCGPCRMMMPYSKQLHERLNDKQKKQIVFLYISIDADMNAWKKGIETMDIQGVNVVSPGNWSSKACRYFSINSIPRYMIMNKKGEVVEFNAKRPADPSILDDLLKYVVE